MNQTHQPPPRPPTVRCPGCTRPVHAEHTFCGYCGHPLRVQCPACGRWTQENHNICPACGTILDGTGLSFAHKQEMETLERTLADLERDQRECTRHLLTARRNERRTIMRLLAVGMLAGACLLLLQALTSSGLSLPGMVLLLLLLLLFRPLIPALPSLGRCLSRWCAPGDLALWREEQRMDNARLTDLIQTYNETVLALADLQACTTGQRHAPDTQTEAHRAEQLLREQRRAEKSSEHTAQPPPGRQRIQGRRLSTDPIPRLFRGTSSVASPLATDQQRVQVRENAEPPVRDPEDIPSR